MGHPLAIQVEVTDLPAALDEVNTLIAIQLALEAAGPTAQLGPPRRSSGDELDAARLHSHHA